jgi:two-component system sensor histidine kinase UhpB
VGNPPAEIALCLFRVAQEALSNAIKHGKAKRIDITLKIQTGLLSMRIKDVGAGFNASTRCGGLGLLSMQERLRFLGGTLELKSQPGVWTEVYAELPFRNPPSLQSRVDDDPLEIRIGPEHQHAEKRS